MRQASILPCWALRTLGRRLRPLPDLDTEDAGPTPQALTPAERDELAAARPFAALPGPRAWPLVGSFGAFVGADPNKLDELFGRLRRRYGDLYRFSHPLRGMETVVTFRHQDVETVYRNEGSWPIRPGLYPVRQYKRTHGLCLGLFASNGREWSDQRGLVQRYMLRADSMLPFLPHMESSAARLLSTLEEDRDDQGSLRGDFLHHAYKAAFDVILKVNLGSEAWASQEDLNAVVRNARVFFHLIGDLEITVNTWRYIATSKWKQFTQVMDSYVGMSDRLTCRALSQPPSDEPRILSMAHQQGLTADQVKALAFDFLIGGVDTSGLSLTYIMYHLATNPSCQERAYREVQENAPAPGQVMTQEHINSLTYVRACVKENLRIKAPLLGMARKLGKDIVLGGYRVPKGTVVFMPNHMIAQLDSGFADGDRFLPERWLRGQEAAAAVASPFASLPFSHGRRMCVGRRLAEQELLLFTARILQRYRIQYDGPPLETVGQLICIPATRLPFTLMERTCQDRRPHEAEDTA